MLTTINITVYVFFNYLGARPHAEPSMGLTNCFTKTKSFHIANANRELYN